MLGRERTGLEPRGVAVKIERNRAERELPFRAADF